MNRGRSLLVVTLMLALAMAACSSGARRVNCDRHLVPINPPVPVVKITAVKTPDP